MSDVEAQEEDIQEGTEGDLENDESGQAEGDGQELERSPPSDPEIEREAAKWGHAPKDKWQGDPNDWVPAEQFLNDPRTQRRIREADKEEMSALRRAADLANKKIAEANKRIAEMEKGGHETRVSNLQRQITAAAEEGNVDEVKRLTDELTKITPPVPEKEESGNADELPEVRDFRARNPWFESDPALNMEAQAIHVRLSREHPHMPLADNLRRVEDEIKKRYPKDFGLTNGARKSSEERVQRVAGSEARGGGGGSDARSFSAIPAADRAIAKKHYIGEGKVFTSEKDYAKAYWDEHGVEQ